MHSLKHEPAGVAQTAVGRQESVHIADNSRVVCAVAMSGFLGRQICELASQADAEATICAYLLGYIETDGSIQLNRLDQGICVNGSRVPTAAHSTDTVIPLYRGSSRGSFYSKALKPGNIFKVAAWLPGAGPIEYAGPKVEFISTSCNVRVSVEPTSAIEISSLPELLAYIRRNPDAKQGPLHRQEESGAYLHDCSPILPPERTIWTVYRSEDSSSTTKTAYIDAGMPRSLHIAQVVVEDDGRSALVRNSLVAPLAGTFSVNVRLASADIAASSSPATSTAKFMPVAQYGHGALGIIHDVAVQHRIEICDAASTMATPRMPTCQPSPLLEKIVASTHALVSPPLPPKTAASISSRSPVVRSNSDNAGNSGIAELLQEQRHIRTLLEEQNNLIKTHVSQTQELVQIARYQPSPQTVTRRYLRMKGTHTPTLANTHRRTSDGGRAMIDTAESTSKQGMRRSNSLSEIVDGIRSFEVEGYEETEHHPRHGFQPHSFASSHDMGSNALAIESPTQTQSTTAGLSQTSSSINNLVSRINRLAGDGRGGTAPVPRSAFERPPLPAYSQTQERDYSHGYKVTPTTQKYLDSLNADNARRPAQRPSRGETFRLNIANLATGSQKSFSIDDERKVRVFYDKQISDEVSGDTIGDEFKGY
ncbi:40S ribosomal protein S6, partial [Coemansia sp. RSA 2618]